MLYDMIRLHPQFTIGPQITEDGLKELSEKGFASVINLTSKGECDQILIPSIEGEKVRALGMEYFHIPTTLWKLRTENIDEICSILASAPKPFYLHCRIGQRSSLLGLIYYALHRGITAPTVLRKSKEFGITWKAPYLESLLTKYVERSRELRDEILSPAISPSLSSVASPA